MEIYDTILNTRIKRIPKNEPIILGRYLEDGKPLLPIKENKIKWNNHSYECKSRLIIEDRLRTKMLNTLEETKVFKDWSLISPLNTEAERNARLTEFELYIIDKFKHLKNICHQPIQKITYNTIKLPVSRAKRIPYKAIRHLAAHSEDWAHRKFQSVIPKNILSEVKDESLFIYENKLTAALIRRLENYLDNRIKELKSVEGFLNDIEYIFTADYKKSKISYQKLNRNFGIAGEVFKNNNLGDVPQQAKESLRKLVALRKKIQALFGTDLYQQCKPKNHSAPEIYSTNILTDHSDYQFVLQIWKKIIATKKQDALSEDEIKEINTNVLEGYYKYCHLLIFRTIMQLPLFSYEVNDDNIQFDNKNGFPKIKLEIINPEIIIHVGNEKITFVCIPDELPVNIKKQIINTKNRFMLCYENTPFLKWPDDDSFDWMTITPSQSNTGIIPISCENIDSIERIGRILNYYILKEYFSQYPFVLSRGEFPKLKNSEIKKWVASKSGAVKIKSDKLFMLEELKSSDFDELNNIAKESCTNIKNREQKKQIEEQWDENISILKNLSNQIHDWKNNISSNFRYRKEIDFDFLKTIEGKEWKIGLKDNTPFVKIPSFDDKYKDCRVVELDSFLGMDFI